MTVEAEPEKSSWMTMAEAMLALRQAGQLPEESARIIYDGLIEGSLLGRADSLETEFSDGSRDLRRDQNVDPGIWTLITQPPLGHRFWISRDIRVGPVTIDEGPVVIGGRKIDLPFGAVLPASTIRGLRLSRDAVEAMTRALKPAARAGRRKGAGGFAKADEPLLQEMHELITAGTVSSVHAAAVQVAHKATGVSQTESKVKRLIDRYREVFADLR